MEEYRLKVYQQLELHNLLDPELMVGITSHNIKINTWWLDS